MNGGQAKDLANPSQPTECLGRLVDGFAMMSFLIIFLIAPALPHFLGGGGGMGGWGIALLLLTVTLFLLLYLVGLFVCIYKMIEKLRSGCQKKAQGEVTSHGKEG